MARYTLHQFDNRDASQMYEYLEARIDAMKRRISELETENQSMRDWIQYQTEAAADEMSFSVEALATA